METGAGFFFSFSVCVYFDDFSSGMTSAAVKQILTFASMYTWLLQQDDRHRWRGTFHGGHSRTRSNQGAVLRPHCAPGTKAHTQCTVAVAIKSRPMEIPTWLE